MTDVVTFEQLHAWMEAQRWFGGKGRSWQVEDMRVLAVLSEREPTVQIVVVGLSFDDGELQDYQVPLSIYDDPQPRLDHVLISDAGPYVYDALHDMPAAARWRDALRTPGETRVGDVTFTGLADAGRIAADASSLVLGGEQSNTSLVVGQEAILKVFRRLVVGTNPDIEVHVALAQAGCQHIAAPLGWVSGSWDADGTRVEASLAMAQEFLRDASGGWELAQASVRDLFAEADLHADEVGGDFASDSRRLGTATADVHADLARALPTAVLSGDELAAVVGAMRRRLDAAATQVPELQPHVTALHRIYDALTADAVAVQRIHGDYHLGQVMMTTHGWRLLDFEGEPAKSLADRTALDSPLRDVAGMLRSLDYAAFHQLGERREQQLAYRAAEWAQRNREAFCDGYGRRSGTDPREQPALLRAYETDKAVYELMYEARNRPTWLRIPLSAIERLAAGDTDT